MSQTRVLIYGFSSSWQNQRRACAKEWHFSLLKSSSGTIANILGTRMKLFDDHNYWICNTKKVIIYFY